MTSQTKIVRLGNYFDILIGGTPSRKIQEYWDRDKLTGNVWLSIRDISGSHDGLISESKEYITDVGVSKSNVKLIPKNTALMTFKLTVGKTVITDRELYTNEAIAAFLPKFNTEVDPYYLATVLPTLKYNMDRAVKGKTLNKAKMEDALIPLPPLDAQQMIARILRTIDDSIQLTAKIIEEVEKLKRALMQSLFTQGINHTRYAQTVLGQLPETWAIVKLDSVAKRGSGHTPNKKIRNYYMGDIKWISLADTNKFDQGLISDTKIKISQEGINNSSAVLHPKGAIILSRDAGVGKSAVLGKDMAVSQHFIVWVCGPRIYNWYLYYFLQLKKPEFERIAVGSTIKTIGLPYFKDLVVQLPPIEEQEKITELLLALDSKISINKRMKASREKLKLRLIQDLLIKKVMT